ncbi:hypothetical protein [Streptomyces syringium]|uniref:zinc finger domain-containing protein n=1 Tax=Streptomyces syringium TaxID=76729 RepID=UPI0037D54B42
MNRYSAPMPDDLRHFMRAQHHPARSVECPHCRAHAHRPCTTRSGRRLLPDLHAQRISAWARTTACCPACQVEPGVECHLDGWPLHDGQVHPQRDDEARRAAL